MSNLVATAQHYDFLADLRLEQVMDHELRVSVLELDRGRLEAVALRHVILDARLELFVRECLTS